MQFFIDYRKQNPVLFKFIVRFSALCLLWILLYRLIWHFDGMMQGYQNFSFFVIDNIILESTEFMLWMLGYETEIIGTERLIKIKDTIGVCVGEPCIGYSLMALYAGLIIAYPKRWKLKLWFVPLGLIIIYCLNILRIGLLAILVRYSYDLWELNHKFIFKIVVYLIVFLLWVWWLKLVKEKKAKA